jgi:hypothetical protein
MIPAMMEVFRLAPFPVLVAGGFVRDAVTGAAAHDIDLFVLGTPMQKAVVSSMLHGMGAAPVSRPDHDAAGDITSERTVTLMYDGVKIQVIRRREFPTGQELVDDFDFHCNAGAVELNGPRAWFSTHFYADARARHLRVLTGGEVNLARIVKFASRGFTGGAEALDALYGQVTDAACKARSTFHLFYGRSETKGGSE